MFLKMEMIVSLGVSGHHRICQKNCCASNPMAASRQVDGCEGRLVGSASVFPIMICKKKKRTEIILISNIDIDIGDFKF